MGSVHILHTISLNGQSVMTFLYFLTPFSGFLIIYLGRAQMCAEVFSYIYSSFDFAEFFACALTVDTAESNSAVSLTPQRKAWQSH